MRALHPIQSSDRIGTLPAVALSALYLLAVFSRASVMTVQPLDLRAAYGSDSLISMLYFAASFGSIMVSLSMPRVLHRLGTRKVMVFGIGLQVLGLILLSHGKTWSMLPGLLFQVAAVAIIEVQLSLLLMAKVPRRALQRFEVFRLFFCGAAWTFGPLLGAWLAGFDTGFPYLAGAAFALALLAAFLATPRPPARNDAPPPPVLKNVPRFFRQPRLTLGWLLAFGRSSWWVMTFVYGPLFLSDLGYSKQEVSNIMAVGLASVFVLPAWGWLGHRLKMRRILILAYSLTSAATLLLALVHTPAWLGATILVAACYIAISIDSAGNVPYLRAVKPSQRRDMTPVFLTYRDASQMIPPGIFALVLLAFPLPAIYFVMAGGTAALAFMARLLPKKL